MADQTLVAIASLAGFGVAAFLMCVGAVSSLRWLTRRSTRRAATVLYPPTFHAPPPRTEPPPGQRSVLPLRPDSGPRDWEQRLRP